ncbi:MAG: XisH family protein [Saprospirales bacterium]|jgi:hypothetical protein|nr:XisH family protein [Saprospirales bacterium]MBK7337528.1 XisH family protein [Saprospirales bacterium]
MAKDIFHEQVKAALKKEGWQITHDPYPLSVGTIGYEVDLGAEKLIAAEKGKEKIAIEIKGFTGPSDVNELHKAVGQFNDYFVALEIVEPDRVLYLAVPESAWLGFFQELVVKKALQRIQAKIIVYNPYLKTIVQWIK